ncbi:MAG: DUF333 domain-containing protein [Patescibacteria group bacterium]
MKKFLPFFIIFAFLIYLGAGCSWFGGQESQDIAVEMTEEQPRDESIDGNEDLANDTVMNNPAAMYCLERGGSYALEKSLAGVAEGYCKLPNGVTCEAWSLYNGDCQAPDIIVEEISTTTMEMMKKDLLDPDELKQTATSVNMEVDIISGNTEKSDDDAMMDPGNNDVDTDGIDRNEKKKLTGSIDIAVKAGTEKGDLAMSWDTHDLEAPEGYIVMLGGDENISYPTKWYHKLDNPDSFGFTWVDLNPDKEFFVRVCIAKGDSCETYSPVISGYAQIKDLEHESDYE